MPETSIPRKRYSQSAICIGAANIDIRCLFDTNSVDGTSNIATISQSVGGAALNTSRILVQNNIHTTFTGLVGNDEGTNLIAGALLEAGVANGLIKLDGSACGRYISMIEPDGSLKTACNDMKIHENISMKILQRQLGKTGKFNTGAVFCDANIPGDVIGQIFEYMSNGLKCATTVSPVKAPRLQNNLDLIDILFTNVVEAKALLNLATNANSEKLAECLVKSPAKSGVISDGGNQIYYWQGNDIGSIPVPQTDLIVDVVGAGDALAAGTIAAVLRGNKFIDAIQNGIISTQKVLQTSGAYSP